MDENILSQLMAALPQQNRQPPPLEMFMRGPQGFALPVPQFQVNSDQYSPGPPRVSGNFQAPAFGGSVSVSGNYQQREFGPPEWGAMLRYNRNF